MQVPHLALAKLMAGDGDARGDVPVPALPECQFCTEEIEDGHPEWEADAGIVRYGRAIYCGFHAYAFLGSEPAMEFNAMGVDC